MDNQKLRIAYHESGHAVMALICRQEIEIVSLRGIGKYPGYMKLVGGVATDAVSEIKICLAGGVGESVFLDNSIKIAIDDLNRAAANIVNLLNNSYQFRKWAEGLDDPGPDMLSDVEEPLVRACIADCINGCVERMRQLKPLTQLIADELMKKEELTGGEVSALFNSYMAARDLE